MSNFCQILAWILTRSKYYSVKWFSFIRLNQGLTSNPLWELLWIIRMNQKETLTSQSAELFLVYIHLFWSLNGSSLFFNVIISH